MNNGSSTCSVLHPLLGCLMSAEEFLGGDVVWDALNDEQRWLLKHGAEGGFAGLSAFAPTEFASKASWDAGEINAWFARNGFSIQLPELGGDEFAVGAIMKVCSKWLREGRPDQLNVGGIMYDAVAMKSFGVMSSPRHSEPILMIAAEGGVGYYMTVHDHERPEGFALYDAVRKIEEGVKPEGGYTEAVFPMIDFAERQDHRWAEGLTAETGGKGSWVVAKCLQESTLRLNHIGAIARSAAGMTLLRCAVTVRKLEIDRPFLLWAKKEGSELPFFTAWLNTDTWKNPGDLDFSETVVD